MPQTSSSTSSNHLHHSLFCKQFTTVSLFYPSLPPRFWNQQNQVVRSIERQSIEPVVSNSEPTKPVIFQVNDWPSTRINFSPAACRLRSRNFLERLPACRIKSITFGTFFLPFFYSIKRGETRDRRFVRERS